MIRRLDGAMLYEDKSDNWRLGVDTDGFNRISKSRHLQYNDPKSPFYHTGICLDGILPREVINQLKEYKEKVLC